MSMHAITIDVPEHLYEILRQRAAGSSRTVQQELIDVLATKLTDDDVAVSRIEHALSGMERYTDAELWDAAAKSVETSESCDRSEELNDRQRSMGLTPAERVELESLVTHYEWNMLIRSKALVLLKRRGHDIAPLLAPPSGCTP